MTDKNKKWFTASASWILALLALVGVVLGVGELRGAIVKNSQMNTRQEVDISMLKTDMAVIKSTTSRTAEDINELKADVKVLLRRP